MNETQSAPSLRGAPDQFIVLCGQIVGNSADGFQTIYGWDGEIHDDRKAAIAAGWKERESDDFNIGVVRDGRLAALDWMDEPLNESGETLIEIEEQIDWRDPRDTFEVGQEADSLQQGGGESDFAWIARLRTHFIDPTTQSEAVASARAEGERYKTALKLAMRLVQRCVGEGIVFEEDDPLPEMESWKVAEAIAETLGIDMNSAAYVDLFKGPLTPGGRTDG